VPNWNADFTHIMLTEVAQLTEFKSRKVKITVMIKIVSYATLLNWVILALIPRIIDEALGCT
jgi:hypothetical protein